MALTENQAERIRNIQAIQASAGLIGLVIGIIYANKTGGGFWRYVGWSFAGSLALGLPAALATTPFKNKILKEGDVVLKDVSERATQQQFDQYVFVQTKSGDNMFKGITPVRKKQLLDNWLKNLSLHDGDVFIMLGGKKEKDLTPSEKKKVDDLLKKWG